MTNGPQYWLQNNRYIENSPPPAQNITTKTGNYLSEVGSFLTSEFDGGTLTSTRNATTSIPFTTTGNGGTLDAAGHTLVFQGAFSNATVNAMGYLVISDSVGGGEIVLSAANTLTGGASLDAGTLAVGNDAALGSGPLAMAAGTTLQFAAPGLLLANPIAMTGDPTFDTDGGNVTLGGVISGSGATLEKIGAGTLILTAAGGRTGTFSTAAYDPAFAKYITPKLGYDASDVTLTLDPTPAPSPAPGPPALFNGGQQVPDALTALASTAAGVGDAVLGEGCGAETHRPGARQQRHGCAARPLGGGFPLGGVGAWPRRARQPERRRHADELPR